MDAILRRRMFSRSMFKEGTRVRPVGQYNHGTVVRVNNPDLPDPDDFTTPLMIVQWDKDTPGDTECEHMEDLIITSNMRRI